MSFPTIEDLRSQLGASPKFTPEYAEKMMHEIPEAAEVDRVQFVLERCKDLDVIEFGASGPLHEGISAIAKSVFGIDKRTDVGASAVMDLDDVSVSDLPQGAYHCEIVVVAEILEHLSNPGHFLDRLKAQFEGIPIIVTTPNAFTDVCRAHIRKGFENVNKEHVSWYSWKTLTTLVTRHGFTIDEFYWYGGDGPTAQGLIMVLR